MATEAQVFATPPRHNGYFSAGKKLFLILGGVAVVVALAFFAYRFADQREVIPVKRSDYHSTKGLPWVPPQEKPVQAAVVHLPPPAQTPVQAGKQLFRATTPQGTPDPALKAPIGIKNQDQGVPSFLDKKETKTASAITNEDGVGEDNDLSKSLLKSNLGGKSKAKVDVNYLYKISPGRHIPINRLTAINSQLPGFVSAEIPQDVYNDDGTLMLLPAGSKVFGEIKNGVIVGNDRVPILWREIRTPDHPPMTITLQSPGADELGRPGATGKVNDHFWETLLATAIYTLVEAGPNIAISALQSNSRGNSQFQLNQLAYPTQNLGSRVLEQRLNRPPILEANPGEPMMIFVGNEIDCSGAVSVRLVGGQR